MPTVIDADTLFGPPTPSTGPRVVDASELFPESPKIVSADDLFGPSKPDFSKLSYQDAVAQWANAYADGTHDNLDALRDHAIAQLKAEHEANAKLDAGVDPETGQTMTTGDKVIRKIKAGGELVKGVAEGVGHGLVDLGKSAVNIGKSAVDMASSDPATSVRGFSTLYSAPQVGSINLAIDSKHVWDKIFGDSPKTDEDFKKKFAADSLDQLELAKTARGDTILERSMDQPGMNIPAALAAQKTRLDPEQVKSESTILNPAMAVPLEGVVGGVAEKAGASIAERFPSVAKFLVKAPGSSAESLLARSLETKEQAAAREAADVTGGETLRRGLASGVGKVGGKAQDFAASVDDHPIASAVIGAAVTGHNPLAAAAGATFLNGPLKNAKIAGSTVGAVGRVLEKTGAALAKEGKISSFVDAVGDAGVSGIKAGAAMSPYALGADSPEEAGQTVGSGAAMGIGIHAAHQTVVGFARPAARAFDLYSSFKPADSGVKDSDIPRPNAPVYGTEHDVANAESLSKLSNRGAATFDALQRMGQAILDQHSHGSNLEVYYLGGEPLKKIAAELGYDPDAAVAQNGFSGSVGNRKVAVVSSEGAEAGLSAGHEVGHVIFGGLDEGSRNQISDAIQKAYGEDGMSAFRDNYNKRLSTTGADLEHSLSDEGVLNEMAAESISQYLNGVPLGKFNAPKGLVDKLHNKIGRSLEGAGLLKPFGKVPVDNEANIGVLGSNPSFTVSGLLDNIISSELLDKVDTANRPAPETSVSPASDKYAAEEIPAAPGFKVGDDVSDASKENAVITKVHAAEKLGDNHEYTVEYTRGGKRYRKIFPESELQSKVTSTAAPKPVTEVAVPPHPVTDKTPPGTAIHADDLFRPREIHADDLFPPEKTTSPEPVSVNAEKALPTENGPATAPEDKFPIRNARVTREQQDAGKTAELPRVVGEGLAKADSAKEAWIANLPPAQRDQARKNYDFFRERVTRNRGDNGPVEVEYASPKPDEGDKSESGRRVAQARQYLAEDAAGRRLLAGRDEAQKLIVPDNIQTNRRDEPFLAATSPDAYLSNIQKILLHLSDKGVSTPYTKGLDLKDNKAVARAAFSPELMKDLVGYMSNQSHGYRGDGKPLIRPKNFSIETPEADKNYTPYPLSEDKVRLLNAAAGPDFLPPSSTRTSHTNKQTEKLPGNVRAQIIAKDNGIEIKPVGDKKFEGGLPIAEVNSLRTKLAETGFNFNDLKSVRENLGLEMVKSFKDRPDLGFRNVDTEVTRAGFQPSNKQVESEPFKTWFSGSKVTDKDGAPTVVYHGTRRPDRVGDTFKPSRATSGPMAFFTDDPDIASNYATGKADTSLEQPADYSEWFKYRPEGARGSVDINRAWSWLTPEEKKTVLERMPDVNEDEDGNISYKKGQGTVAGDWPYYLSREGQGNPLKAAVELWLNSGTLFGSEHEFLDVLKEAGFPMNRVEYDNPRAVKSAVYPVYLTIRKPFDTSTMPDEVIDALNDAGKRKRARVTYGADQWDKNSVSGTEWLERLAEDQKNGTTHAWTSVPDWVTETLQRFGYDGIKDAGGKFHSTRHDVWIPFRSNQIKSAIGNKGRFDPGKDNIRFQPAVARAPVANPIESVRIIPKAGINSIPLSLAPIKRRDDTDVIPIQRRK